MRPMHCTVDIQAPKEVVWKVLWDDTTFRDWAGSIDEGTYMVGELKEGGEIQYISAVNGYGVTSLVEKLIVGEYVLLKHAADTQENGTQTRENEWAGGAESYTLTESGGITTLTLVCDIPTELEEYFAVAYPKALARIKVLAETAT